MPDARHQLDLPLSESGVRTRHDSEHQRRAERSTENSSPQQPPRSAQYTIRRMRVIISVALAFALSAPAAAQWIGFKTPGVPRLPDGRPNLSAPAPRTAVGKPDLSGIWQAGRAGQYRLRLRRYAESEAGRRPAVGARLARQTRAGLPQRQSARALHAGERAFLNFRGLSRMVQTPQMIVILYESPNSPHRTIFMDGRELPKDPNPTWLGYSVGRWEGDTLVVSTIGFNELGWLDVDGNPQTESLKLTERFHRKDFGHLELDTTFDDPKVFTKPFSLHMEKALAPDTEILEDICENEKSGAHLTGGVIVLRDVLAKYAGTYDLGGRQLVVSVQGDQLLVEDPQNALDKLFVARSETTFSSSVSQVALEFVRDARGNVTHLVRRVGSSEQKAVKK